MQVEKKSVPVRIVEIELSRPLSAVAAEDTEKGIRYARALALVRLHSFPIGAVELEFDEGGIIPAETFAHILWRELGDLINAHLEQDRGNSGMNEIDALDASGLPYTRTPTCLIERERFLERAPHVSILVATHNRPDQLSVCLDSLLALAYPSFDIIVIDNAPSNDETRTLVTRRYRQTGEGSPRVRYVREDVAGLARAHNRGVAETDARFVAITDDDVTVDRYWLAGLMRGFTLAEDVGCVTGSIFPAEIETEAQYWIERAAGFTKGYRRQMFDIHENRPDHPLFPYAAGMFGSGANMAFDTAILRKAGGFDDSLGAGSMALGGDDLASFFQILAHGYTLVYEPAAIIYHMHYREYARLCKTAYGYGAGLTAYLTKTLLDRPSRLVGFARRVPYGLYYALSHRSPKNARKADDYPGELNQLERRGMLAGPFLYLRSRRNMNRLRDRARRGIPVAGSQLKSNRSHDR